MKNLKWMKGSWFPITIASLYLLLYVILLCSGFGLRYALLMFSLSPLIIIWMVVRILKSPATSSKTFDEYFYEDIDLKKR